MEHFFSLIVRSIFVDNMIFAFFLGMCSYLAVSKNVRTALGLGAAVTFVLVVTLPVNYLLQTYVLSEGALIPGVDLSFLSFILFIAVIAAIVALLIGGAASVDYNPISQEEQAAAVDTIEGNVYWTQFGKVYHTHEDCSHLNNTDTLYTNTVAEAIAAGRTRLCKTCAARDSVQVDENGFVVSKDDAAVDTTDTAETTDDGVKTLD